MNTIQKIDARIDCLKYFQDKTEDKNEHQKLQDEIVFLKEIKGDLLEIRSELCQKIGDTV